MKKPKYVAPRMYVREMLDGPDLERMLASGSHVLAVLPKKPSDVALRQREFVRRREAAGYKHFHVLLPAHVYSLLLSCLREGETQAELVERLLSNLADIFISQAGN